MKPFAGYAVASFAALCLAAVFAAPPAHASSAAVRKPGCGESARKWKSLDPGQKSRLVEKYRRWKGLGPEEREKARRKFEKYYRPDSGSSQSRPEAADGKRAETWKKLVENYARWASMPPEKKQRLLAGHKAFRKLPKARVEQLLTLKPEQRARAFAELLEDARLDDMAGQFSAKEKDALRDLKGDEKRAAIRGMLSERRKQQLRRISEAARERMKGLPAGAAKTELKRELERVSLKDQAVLFLLDPKSRKEFADLPVDERDAWAIGKLKGLASKLEQAAPAQVVESLKKLPEQERLWKLAGWLFEKKIESLAKGLLPAQAGEIAGMGLAGKIERIRHLLKQNHQKVLRSIPEELREKIKDLPQDAQRRAVSEHIASRIPRDFWKGLSREEKDRFFRMPLLERLQAMERFRRAGERAAKQRG